MEQVILSPIPVPELVKLISDAVLSKSPISPEKAPSMQEMENFLTRQEVSKLFHISLVTLNKHTKSKRLKAHRIGARVLYKKSEIIQALTSIK